MARASSARLAGLAVIVACFLLAGCGSSLASNSPKPEQNPPALRTVAEAVATPVPARDFALESLSGETISLGDLRGQWVLVNFWATWCAPCVSEMPYLQRVADERDMVVLGVNFKESTSAVRRFVEESSITFPILMNPDEVLLLFYQARSLPRTHVIDPEGNIALSIIGAVDEGRFETWLDDQGIRQK